MNSLLNNLEIETNKLYQRILNGDNNEELINKLVSLLEEVENVVKEIKIE